MGLVIGLMSYWRMIRKGLLGGSCDPVDTYSWTYSPVYEWGSLHKANQGDHTWGF